MIEAELIEKRPVQLSGNVNGLIFARATSPTHFGCGTGQGHIDLPVARATDTGLPIGPGSSVRGAIRTACRAACTSNSQVKQTYLDLFGPEFSDDADGAGILQIDDLRMLAMPVRSPHGLAVWVTSPALLSWFNESITQAGLMGTPDAPQPFDAPGQCWASNRVSLALGTERKLVAFDLDFNVVDSGGQLDQWAQSWRSRFAMSPTLWSLFSHRLAVIPDTAIAYLSKFATDVRPRIRRNDDGTVTDKAFWQEEYLPRDTLWYAQWSAQPVRKAALQDMQLVRHWLCRDEVQLRAGEVAFPALPERVQIGGKASIHKGYFELRFE